MDVRTLPTHPGTGLAAIGFTRRGTPIWPLAGGADDGGGDDAGDGEGGDEGDAGDEGDEAGDGEEETAEAWKPPTQEEWEAQAGKLKRANDQARRLREQMKAAGVQSGPAKAAPAKAAPAKKAAPAAVAVEPEETPAAQDDGELERWQVRALKADAKAELLGRGCDPKMVNLALGQLKPGEVDWDGDSPILDEWLDQMEDDYPALFAKRETPQAKAGPRKAGSIDQGAGATGAPAEKQRPYGESVLRRGGWGREGTAGIAGRRR